MNKGLTRGMLAVVLGGVLGFVFYFIASFIYGLGLTLLAESGGDVKPENPAFWFVRAIAWAVFGVTGGTVYGIAGQSEKKYVYGMLGAGIRGLLFDPINLLCGVAKPSRCIGMMILGATTGISIGLVVSALKNKPARRAMLPAEPGKRTRAASFPRGRELRGSAGERPCSKIRNGPRSVDYT